MNPRDRQILRAVQAGNGRIVCDECGGVLLVDAVSCCGDDVISARRVLDNRLVAPQIPGQPGMRVLAILTDAGKRELGVAA